MPPPLPYFLWSRSACLSETEREISDARYKITLHSTVSVPGLPGCWSQGRTEADALVNIEDAIREYLAVVAEQLRNVDTQGRDAS